MQNSVEKIDLAIVWSMTTVRARITLIYVLLTQASHAVIKYRLRDSLNVKQLAVKSLAQRRRCQGGRKVAYTITERRTDERSPAVYFSRTDSIITLRDQRHASHYLELDGPTAQWLTHEGALCYGSAPWRRAQITRNNT